MAYPKELGLFRINLQFSGSHQCGGWKYCFFVVDCSLVINRGIHSVGQFWSQSSIALMLECVL